MRTPPANAVLDRIGRLQPMRIFPREVSGVYGKSLHRDHAGEWDFDLTWKPLESFPVRFGWLRAIRAGHARVHRGLEIRLPRPGALLGPHRLHDRPRRGCAHDRHRPRRHARSGGGPARSGSNVTSIAVPGAVHDVVLSRPKARERAYAEIQRWLTTYVL